MVSRDLGLSLAEQIRDSVPGDAEQPRVHVLDWLHESRGFDELAQDILKDVFRLVRVGHPLTDEAPQPAALSRNRVDDSLVLLGGGQKGARQRLFPSLCRRTAS